ncbi:hypothetical protein [Yersinia enterocolitica]|uniref:hypothetical protein n=1 Tax=Yersinia enterocolitica TaxID=630 RepID=UPI0029AD9678|nr:hypothetical protein [Yersinia enterocolitica]
MHTQITSTSKPPLQEPTERYGFTEAMFWDVYQHVISLVGGTVREQSKRQRYLLMRYV